MKTIVVAIDFSKWSKFALRYAIRIANQIEADVIMVWVDKVASRKSFYSDIKSNYLVEVKIKFEQLVDKYGKKLLKGKLEYKIRKGKVHTEVINQAIYSDAYLIIAGTHGVSGFEEFWIGSNAYRIVASALCPVITIRNGFCLLESASKILLPIDSTIETRQKVPFTVNLAKAFNAEIKVLGLYSAAVDDIINTVDSYTAQTVNYIKNHNVRYSLESVKVEKNIADTVIDFITKNGIDLVSILTEQEQSFSNIILGSQAQQIVNYCPVPVFTMHSADIFDIATR